MYQRILVTLDGSDLAECSLSHVKAIASGCNVPEVVVLRVIEPLTASVTAALAEAGDVVLTQAQQNAKSEAITYAGRIAAQLKKDGVNARPVTVNGTPAEAILAYAEKNKADLIIMSTHGRSGISRWLLGSVADRVVRHSPAPVLTVAPEGCRVA